MVVGPAQWGTCICTVSSVGEGSLAYWNNNIATTSFGGYDIIVLDALTGSQTAVLSGHMSSVTSLTYSSDGTFLVSGSNDKTIKLWDVQTGGVIKTLHGHTDRVCSVSISADDTMIASVSQDRRICLWNIRTGKHFILERYKYLAGSVTFSPTNSQLLFSSSDGIVKQWDNNGNEIGFPFSGDHVTFSPDSTQFVSWESWTATIRNTDSRVTVVEFDLGDLIDYCCFSPNGRFIAAAASCTIYLWDITGSKPCLIQTLTGHIEPIVSLVFSSPYNLVSVSHDSVKFWQIGASSADLVFPNSKSSSPALSDIRSVSLQARDGLAFSIDLAGVVKAWDILTGHCKKFYETEIEEVHYADIQLISDRLIIVWGKQSGQEINVWDAEKGKLQTIGTSYFQGLQIIGDGSRALQLSNDSIQAWDIWTGKSVWKEKLREGVRNFNIFQRGQLGVSSTCFDSLRMDSSKVLIDLDWESVQGWDFGTPGSTPTQFSKTSSSMPRLNFVGRGSNIMEDSVTGKEVFWLCGRYAQPSAIQWDGQYLIAGYISGEVLILDFNDVLSDL